MHLSCVRVARAALLTLALSAAAVASPPRTHHVARRSFFDLQCKGIYDAGKFATLDRICDDCYNLFRETEVFGLCREECFTSHYFKGCVDVLQESDKLDLFKEYIIQLHGIDPYL